MPIEVELDIFSGRPNPKWKLSPRLESELFEQMDALAPDPRGSFPQPPGLGYRGFLLRKENETREHDTRVYGGAVTTAEGVKKDPARRLEKWLLKTAETAHSVEAQILDIVKDELS